MRIQNSKTGQVVEFKDGTPDEEIAKYFDSMEQPEPQSTGFQGMANSIKDESFQPKTGKDYANQVINVAQVAAQFTPFSPATEFAGESAKSLISGESPTTAIKRGSAAAATDAAITYTGGKVIEAASMLPKWLLKREAGNMATEIVDEAIQRPELLQATSESIDSLGKKFHSNIKYTQQRIGELVGQAKKAIKGQKIKMDFKPIANTLRESEKAAGLVVDKGHIPLQEDKNALSAFSTLKSYIIDEFYPKGTHKKLIGKDPLGIPTYETKTLIGKPKDVERANEALNNIDSSDSFQAIYTKLINKQQLTKAEAEALKVRNQFSKEIDNASNAIFDLAAQSDSSLADAKAQYAKFKSIVDNPTVRSAQKGADKSTSLLKQSLNEGKQELYQQLRAVDNQFDESTRMMDDVVRNRIHRKIDSDNSIQNSVLKKTSAKLLAPSSKYTKGARSTGKSLIRRASAQTASDIFAEDNADNQQN